jgi:Raf kinase inhibitor-like YbhB/YbcL family protein
MKKVIVFLGVFLIFWQLAIAGESHVMELKSPEFKDKEYIPKKFTCRGENINPALIIESIPSEAKSLALIIDDPDAPGGDWVHWVVFNIPVISRIEEGSAPGKQGITDFGRMRYDGPCPPFGTHRYMFKIYALDTMLNLTEGVTKAELEKAMDGHMLAKAELTGLSKR